MRARFLFCVFVYLSTFVNQSLAGIITDTNGEFRTLATLGVMPDIDVAPINNGSSNVTLASSTASVSTSASYSFSQNDTSALFRLTAEGSLTHDHGSANLSVQFMLLIPTEYMFVGSTYTNGYGAFGQSMGITHVSPGVMSFPYVENETKIGTSPTFQLNELADADPPFHDFLFVGSRTGVLQPGLYQLDWLVQFEEHSLTTGIVTLDHFAELRLSPQAVATPEPISLVAWSSLSLMVIVSESLRRNAMKAER